MSTVIPAVTATIVKHCMLINIEVNSTTYYISNAFNPITWNGNTYTQLGNLLNISELQDELRASNNQITVTLSGIPPDDGSPNYMNIVLNSNIKGSRIEIYRAFFDPTTNNFQASEVYQRFSGYISNYALNENWDQDNKITSNSISVQCSSIHAIIERQYTGRRTNDSDQKFWYPSDTGMYRVKIISDGSFDFGRPYSAPSSPSITTPSDNNFIESPGA